jgi:hypothetical protein
MYNSGSNFGGGAGQAVMNMFQTGVGPHGFYIKADSNPQSVFFSVDDGSITQTNQVSNSYVLTQVTVSGGTVTYTGTITNGGSNHLAGKTVAISGFVNGGNNVTSFAVTSSSGTTLVGTTTTQVNETHAGAAGINYPAPSITLNGNYWNGAANVDTWAITPSIGGASSSTPASTLNVTHSGSSGALLFNLGSIALTCGILTAPTLIESTTHTPSSAADTGTTGQIAWDASFIYICTATNTWKRVAIATW